MGTWFATVSILVLGGFQLASSLNQKIAVAPTRSDCAYAGLVEPCAKKIYMYPNLCDSWNELRDDCLIDNRCSDIYIQQVKNDFEKKNSVQCPKDWYKFCNTWSPSGINDIVKCVKRIYPDYYSDKCDAWMDLKHCYAAGQCSDTFIKDQKQAFETKYNEKCFDDWQKYCSPWSSSGIKDIVNCVKRIKPASYSDKCDAWKQLKDCYTEGRCTDTFIKDQKQAFETKYNEKCFEVTKDAGSYYYKGVRISALCAVNNVTCETGLRYMSCELWHAFRKCFDSAGCLYSEVEKIKTKALKYESVTCGTGTVAASVGIIFLVVSMFIAR